MSSAASGSMTIPRTRLLPSILTVTMPPPVDASTRTLVISS